MAIFTNSPKTARGARSTEHPPEEQDFHPSPELNPAEIEYISTPHLRPVPGQEQEAHFGSSPTGIHALDHLVRAAEESVATLTHAAENVENGGLKLLIKVVAATRATRVKRMRAAAGLEESMRQDATEWAHERHIADGMTDIQASMSVRREERQHLALYELAKSEAELLDAYDAVLRRNGNDPLNSLPQPIIHLLEQQRSELQSFHNRLSYLDEKRAPLVVARVVENEEEAKHLAAELHNRGLAPDQVDILPVGGAMVRASAEVAKPASPRSTVVAGAVTGGIVGGVIGLALALYIMFEPAWVGSLTVGPLWFFLGTLIAAALMGAAFGWIIGQNRKEDDRNVALHHLHEGECLVAAFPSQVQVPAAEDVLQIHHARSLGA